MLKAGQISIVCKVLQVGTDLWFLVETFAFMAHLFSRRGLLPSMALTAFMFPLSAFFYAIKPPSNKGKTHWKIRSKRKVPWNSFLLALNFVLYPIFSFKCTVSQGHRLFIVQYPRRMMKRRKDKMSILRADSRVLICANAFQA